jgi:chaperone required for assembly of F1-ATPase
MRDLLNPFEAAPTVSDPDPVRRAQIQMKAPLPKRFYTAVDVGASEAGHVVLLDGKVAKTPAQAPLRLPTAAAARLVASEFDAQQEVVDPVTMPVMRLANTAIDGVAAEPGAVLEDILRFASSDLLCYRAEGPEGLVRRQNEAWDGILDWACAQLGARMVLAEGIVFVEQPRDSIAALGLHLRRDPGPFRLAALHLVTSLTGSALLALALEARALDPEPAWTAAHVDEDWQIDQWGQDAEAIARRNARKRDYLAAAALLAALETAD